jgi:hypothetical protein
VETLLTRGKKYGSRIIQMKLAWGLLSLHYSFAFKAPSCTSGTLGKHLVDPAAKTDRQRASKASNAKAAGDRPRTAAWKTTCSRMATGSNSQLWRGPPEKVPYGVPPSLQTTGDATPTRPVPCQIDIILRVAPWFRFRAHIFPVPPQRRAMPIPSYRPPRAAWVQRLLEWIYLFGTAEVQGFQYGDTM